MVRRAGRVGAILCAAIMALLVAGCGDDGANEPVAGGQTTDQRFQWKLVTAWPPNLPVNHDAVLKFAEDVEIMSRGRLRIQVFAGGELIPALQAFDAVSQGSVEMAHAASYYWAGKVPAAQFLTVVPFGMTQKGAWAWIYGGGGLKLWRELYEPFGLIPFPMGNTGIQMGGWFKKEINTVADFEGLKMRMPGLGGKVIARLGAKPVLLPAADIFPSLETGVIDAAEWVGPYHDYLMGFHKVADYYYAGGWHEPGSVLELIVNKQAWDALPADLQQIVRSCAAETDRSMYAQWQARDAEYLAKIRAAGKTQLREFGPEVTRRLRQISAELLQEVAATSDVAGRIYQSFTSFQKTYEAFQQTNEQSYERAQRA